MCVCKVPAECIRLVPARVTDACLPSLRRSGGCFPLAARLCVSKKHVAPQEASLSSVYGCCRATNLRPLHSPRVYCSALIIRRVTVLKTGTALASPGLYNSSVPSTDSPTKHRFNGESVDCTRRASDVFALQFTRLVGRGCACGHLPRFFFFPPRCLSAVLVFHLGRVCFCCHFLWPLLRGYGYCKVARVAQPSAFQQVLLSQRRPLPQVTDAAHTLAFVLSPAPALALLHWHLVFTFTEQFGGRGRSGCVAKARRLLILKVPASFCAGHLMTKGSFLSSLSHHAVTHSLFAFA